MNTPDPTSAEPQLQAAPPWSPANLFSWLAIVALMVVFLAQNGTFDAAVPQGVPTVNAAVSPQVSILLRFANIAGTTPTDGSAPANGQPPADSNAPASGQAASNAQFAMQLSALGGSINDMLKDVEPGGELGCAVVLARLGKVEDAKKAVADLEARIASGRAKTFPEFDTLVKDVNTALDAIASGHAGPTALTDAQVHMLKSELGSAGESLVAMATNDVKTQDALAGQGIVSVVALGAVVVLGVLVALLGFVALGVMVVLGIQGRLVGVQPPTAPAGKYAAVFAIWLGSFFLLIKGPSWFMAPASPEVALGVSILGSVVSCGIALWAARMLGIGWKQFAADTGLTRPALSDLLWGVVCYFMAVALLIVGLCVVFVLLAISGSPSLKASHPIQQIVSDSGWFGVALTYVVAAVCAPLFEELFFRGALYQNLRATWGPWVGALGAGAVATLVSSVVFAAIHPQGLIFVPVLGALAVAFCLMREWRGTILPGMWAHGINNAIMITLNILLLR